MKMPNPLLPKPRRKPQYKFYATLLDSFSWYLKSDRDEAFQDFIDKLNRVPFTSEAAEKGTAFNELVDIRITRRLPDGLPEPEYDYDKWMIQFKGFKFKMPVVEHFVERFRQATPQVYTEGVLETSRGSVLLYGFIDELFAGHAHDIKCTSKYNFPKFLHNWQHLVYPFCLQEQGVPAENFTYEITDYNNLYREEYQFKRERDLVKLQGHCEHLIDFIETHRHLITDKKLFALDDELVQAE